MLLVLPSCGIPPLRNPEPGPGLPADFNGATSLENSAQLGLDEFFTDRMFTRLIGQALVGNRELRMPLVGLVEHRAVTIHRDQHFYARNMLLSCMTAPLYDHEGRLVAALDVSSCRADLIESFINLISTAVIEAAARIEAECFCLAYPRARILFVPIPDKMGKAMIAVDQDDLVIGATRAARQGLGISQSCLQKSLPVAEVLNMSGRVTENLATAERGVLQRALKRADGNVTAAAEALRTKRLSRSGDRG